LLNRSNRHLLAGAVLFALLFRAMIPAGFMPAGDGSFSLQVCHSGFLTQDNPNDGNGRSGGHAHVEYCSFGALPGAGPISHVIAFLASWSAVSQPFAEFTSRPPSTRLERAHAARGPPRRFHNEPIRIA
jgi:hypothetical protein